VIKNHVPVILRDGNWAHEFYRLVDMLTYIEQFSGKKFIEEIINHKKASNGK
jgi:hypothetical protein